MLSRKRKKNRSIDVKINSEGGASHIARHILGIIEHAKSCGVTVKTFVTCSAISYASLIAAAGSKGYRFINPIGYMYIHYGSTGTIREQSAKALESAANYIKFNKKQLADMYSYYTKLTNKQIDDAFQSEGYFFFPHECVKYGLVDHVMFPDKKIVKDYSLNHFK